MTVLVAYASKHGSTQGIAERITEKFRQWGKEVEVKPLDAVEDPKELRGLCYRQRNLLWVMVEGGHRVGASK